MKKKHFVKTVFGGDLNFYRILYLMMLLVILTVRGRQYPWGIVEVDNISHCDFLALRNMVIRTHMQDLKDVTNNVHYENYR